MKEKTFGLALVLIVFGMVFSCTKDEDVVTPETPDPVREIVHDTVQVHDTVYVRDTEQVPDSIDVKEGEPLVWEFTLLASKNPERLVSDVRCEITGDSLIEGWIPHLTDDKLLKPHIKCIGKVSVNGIPVTSDITEIDFSDPITLKVEEDGNIKLYKVLIHAYTGLPVCWIETEGRQKIESKDQYLKAHMTIKKDVVTRASAPYEVDMEIKGRGNSTWQLPKKPFRIKLDAKESILDMPKGKSWVMLANYTDKTMIRNKLAYYLGSLSRLDWTPQSHFVEVWINGRYNGTYQFCEKVSVSKQRVDISEEGFLLEIDAYASGEADSRYFVTQVLPQPINIKEPQVTYGDANYNLVRNFVLEAESTLYSYYFADPETGWQKYFDATSLVDWYLVNEIGKSWDAIRWSSTFMTWTPGGKIVMGPLWDYDLAFGNADASDGCDSSPEGFQIKPQAWMHRFFEDPYFVQLVKERWQYFYAKKKVIMAEINADANYLKLSAQENDNKWQTFYRYTERNRDIWGSYMNEIEYLKHWLNVRMEWLDKEFAKM